MLFLVDYQSTGQYYTRSQEPRQQFVSLRNLLNHSSASSAQRCDSATRSTNSAITIRSFAISSLCRLTSSINSISVNVHLQSSASQKQHIHTRSTLTLKRLLHSNDQLDVIRPIVVQEATSDDRIFDLFPVATQHR